MGAAVDQPGKQQYKIRWGRVGVLGVAIVASAVVIGTNKASKPSPQKAASAYINKLGAEASSVQGYVQLVLVDVGSNADINKVAQDAQQAHGQLDTMRNDFAYPQDSGNLGNAEVEVLTAANDLKNAMGALVAYTGNPNPATLAQFKTSYNNAAGEWDHGVKTIWSAAGRSDAPTLGS